MKIELIKFFDRNPHTLGTVQDLALAIGRNSIAVTEGLKGLVAARVIEKNGSRSAIWSYGPNEKMEKRMSAFMRAYERPDLRQWIVSEVIRRGG